MNHVSIQSYFSAGVSLETFREIKQSVGVEQIHVSVISGRCGSTFLSHLCEQVGFGKGEEPFNEWPEEGLRRIAAPDRFDDFLRFVLKSSSISGRSYLQVDAFRLKAIRHLLPPVDSPFPDATKITVILRRNIVAQAISYVNAEVTGLWHSNQTPSSLETPAEFSEERFLHWLKHVCEMEKAILDLFPMAQPDTFFYEDIASMPLEVITLFLQRSGFSVRPILTQQAIISDAAPKKILRSEYAIQYISMVNKFPWLNDVLVERASGFPTSRTLDVMLKRMG